MNKMGKNDQTIDIGQFNQKVEFEKHVSAGTSQLSGREFRISEYNHTRGKPNIKTNPIDIGTDGKTDYYTITTVESFTVPPRKGETAVPVNHFFVTKAIGNQIERALADNTVREAFENGARLGPVKVTKKANSDPTKNDYWALVFPSDTGYKGI